MVDYNPSNIINDEVFVGRFDFDSTEYDVDSKVGRSNLKELSDRIVKIIKKKREDSELTKR